MRNSLKTTTALLASLALVVPSVLPAQQNGAVSSTEQAATDLTDAVDCPEGVEPPCVEAEAATDDAAKMTKEERKAAKKDERATEKDAEKEAAKAAKQAEKAAEKAAKTPAPAEADAPVEPRSSANAPAANVVEPATDEAAPAAEADAPVEPRSSADAPAANVVEPATEKAAPAAEAMTDDAIKKRLGANDAPEAKAADQAQSSSDADADKAEAKAAKAKAKADMKAEEKAAAQAEKDKDAEKAARQAEKKADKKAERAEGNDEAVDTSAKPKRRPKDDVVEVAPAPAAAASAEEGSADAEVTTETLTEDNSRSSDEDFEGKIEATAGAAPAKDNGLSKLEKALLLGAGALVVGAVIKGNREVVSTSQDRLVVTNKDGGMEVIKDDNALLRRPGSNVETQTFSDGSTRTVTTREDGTSVVTIRDADLRVLRRALVRADGTQVLLIDDTVTFEPVDVTTLPAAAAPVAKTNNADELRAALERDGVYDRRFSLGQIRQISEVRKLAPSIEVDTITFETGSAAIRPTEAEKLGDLGRQIAAMIDRNPNEIFLVEGHTDAVGAAGTNLILSDRRAESLALALTEYFGVPPENLVVQGYGESDLKVEVDSAERANRRAGLRRITGLMQVASLN